MPNDHQALLPLSPTGAALAALNAQTIRFGLTLSQTDITALEEKRLEALAATGRVEFSEGILPALAHAFCDSPNIPPAEWPQTLAELQEVFYHLKNETEDRLADDTILSTMRRFFDVPCGGSPEAVGDLLTQHIAQAMRAGQRVDLAALDPLDSPFAQFYKNNMEDA